MSDALVLNPKENEVIAWLREMPPLRASRGPFKKNTHFDKNTSTPAGAQTIAETQTDHRRDADQCQQHCHCSEDTSGPDPRAAFIQSIVSPPNNHWRRCLFKANEGTFAAMNCPRRLHISPAGLHPRRGPPPHLSQPEAGYELKSVPLTMLSPSEVSVQPTSSFREILPRSS
ncbi:hypothetical protein LZ30DRAFT_27667 [Colletotrichum cereale]|nr:hypothetical protein LZ30DRAFT_27667 [Colletotrichum cereale]